MPDAKDNAKLTGDTHPPEVEDLPKQRGLRDEEESPAGAEQKRERRTQSGRKAKTSKDQGPATPTRAWTPDDPEPKDESRLG